MTKAKEHQIDEEVNKFLADADIKEAMDIHVDQIDNYMRISIIHRVRL